MAADAGKRKRMWITLGVVALLNAGLGGGVYWVYSEWKKQDTLHKQKVKEKLGLEADLDKNKTKKAELADLDQRFVALKDKLPTQERVAELLRRVEEVAQKNSCDNKSMVKATGGTPTMGAVSYIQEAWKTKWKAPFWGFAKLMNNIEEDFPRFIAFENVSVNPANSGVVLMGAPHDFSVDMVTYRYVMQDQSK
jgi:Tfp pilus assembly protein PilO